jgi:hypothetical protein
LKKTTLKKARVKSKALEVKEMQKEAHPTGSSNRIDLIEQVISLRTNPLTHKDMAMITGASESTIKNICMHISKIDLYSPEMKEKAVIAAGKLLETGTETSQLKIINKIYPDKDVATQNPSALNININAKDLDFKNEKDYIDVSEY